MKTIKNDTISTLIIKNSKFICLLKKINSKEEIELYLNEAKQKYKDATHYCYAYIIDNLEYACDDNEPSGTAGIPILNVLKKNDLNHILAIVVRYFGGIKLGAGGLVRAYTNSVTNCLDKDNIKDLIIGKNIDLIFDYKLQKQIDFICKDEHIIDKKFNEDIIYNIDIKNDTLDILNNLDVKIIINKDIYI